MKSIIVLTGVLAMTCSIQAQAYITAVGARLGPAIGITLQQRIMKRTTLEVMIQHRNFLDQTTAGILIEKHLPLIWRNLNFYTGAGVQKTWYRDLEYSGGDPWGVQFVGGAELSLARFNVSWDFKPVINVSSGDPVILGQSAISIRYILIKDQKKGLFRGKKKKGKGRRKRR